MQKAKIILKIELSREYEDSVGEQHIEQVLMRVANRIAGELRWQIDNPGLTEEERFNIDKLNATIECGSGKSGTFAGARFGKKTTASTSRTSGSVSVTHRSIERNTGNRMIPDNRKKK